MLIMLDLMIMQNQWAWPLDRHPMKDLSMFFPHSISLSLAAGLFLPFQLLLVGLLGIALDSVCSDISDSRRHPFAVLFCVQVNT